MPSKAVLISILSLFMLAGCGGSGPAPATSSTEEDTAKINQLRDSFISAFNSGDAAAIASLYASDAVAMPQNQPAITGPDAIMKLNKGTFDNFTPKITIKSEEVKISGDLAFDRGTYTLELAPRDKGNAVSDEGKYLIILQRQSDGAWKVFRDIDNSSKPLAPPPPPPPAKK